MTEGRGELGSDAALPDGPYKCGLTHTPQGDTPPWTVTAADGLAIAGHVPSKAIADAIADALNGAAQTKPEEISLGTPYLNQRGLAALYGVHVALTDKGVTAMAMSLPKDDPASDGGARHVIAGALKADYRPKPGPGDYAAADRVLRDLTAAGFVVVPQRLSEDDLRRAERLLDIGATNAQRWAAILRVLRT